MAEIIKLSEVRGHRLAKKIEIINTNFNRINTKMSSINRTVWLCIFEDYVISFDSMKSAVRAKIDGKLAIVPVEINCVIGEGLEEN